MVNCTINSVRKILPFNRFKRFLAPGFLVFALLLLGSTTAIAQESSPDKSALTPSEIEKLYPMTPAEEAAIVHTIPSCPLIIDGILYEAKQISLFDGQRLHFALGYGDTLTAFTTVEGLEKFQSEQSRLVAETVLRSIDSVFYIDWWYSGSSFALPAGSPPYPDLGAMFDNCISSVESSTGTSWTHLYDYTYYGGDSLSIAGGRGLPVLALYGWNDKTSSVWVE